MADATGQQALTLKDKLLASGSSYAFYQAYRLLNLLNAVEKSPHPIHVRPNLSLAFPETDIDCIQQLEDASYRVTANFMGLYGVSSPLPTFYTEDLLEEFRQDRHAQRDLFDLINRTIYPLLVKVWLKSKPQISFLEMNQRSYIGIFFSFIGLNHPERFKHQPGIESLIRFAGIYSMFPRSALGLKTILSGVFKTVQVEVVQCPLKIVNMPYEQRCLLGSQGATLGEDSHIGCQILDRSNNLTIELTDVSEALFRLFMPGQLEYRRLNFLVRYYLVDPLNVTLRLVLAKGAAKGSALGISSWSALGLDSWLSPQSCLIHEVNYTV